MKRRLRSPFPRPPLKVAEAGLKQTSAALSADGIVQTPGERKEVPTMRRGGERIIVSVTDLARKHGANLPGITPESVEDSLALGRELSALKAEANQARTVIVDTGRQAYAEAWDGVLALYRVLERTSESDPKLHAALAPIRKFLTVARKKASDTAESNGEAAADPNGTDPQQK